MKTPSGQLRQPALVVVRKAYWPAGQSGATRAGMPDAGDGDGEGDGEAAADDVGEGVGGRRMLGGLLGSRAISLSRSAADVKFRPRTIEGLAAMAATRAPLLLCCSTTATMASQTLEVSVALVDCARMMGLCAAAEASTPSTIDTPLLL